jgi:hypothetical protein
LIAVSHALRAAVGEKRLLHARQLAQLLRQSRLRLGQKKVAHMHQQRRLLRDALCQFRVAVPHITYGNPREEVQVGVAELVV